MSTSNAYPGLGISSGEQPRMVENEEHSGVHSVNAFARALREPRESVAATSSTSEEHVSPRAIQRQEEFPNVDVGYEQGTTIPYVTDRTTAMRMMTRKVQILGDDPYRLPGVPDNATLVSPAKDDFDIGYEIPGPLWVKPGAVLQSVQALRPTIHSGEPARESHVAQITSSARYSDRDTLKRLEGKDSSLLPDPFESEWEHIDTVEKVPVSKFSPSDSDPGSPPKLTGIFRSVSTKVKGALRCRPTVKKGSVSGPTNFHDLDPRYPNGEDVHPEIQAVPLAEAQRKLYRQAHPEISAPFDLRPWPENDGYNLNPKVKCVPIKNPAPELIRRPNLPTGSSHGQQHYPHALKARPSKSKRTRKLAVPPPLPSRPRKVKIVGREDQMTEFGDLIRAAEEESIYDEDLEVKELPTDEDYSLLEIKPLRPRNPPACKKVDTSKYDWVPPQGSPGLPTPVRVTSEHDWRMSEEYPTADILFEQLDRQVVEMGIPEVKAPSPGKEVSRQQRRLDGYSPSPKTHQYEESEADFDIDTFIHEKHSSWIAMERPNFRREGSTHKRIHREEHDNSAEQDEAAKLMERLRRMRAGEIF